VFTHINVNIASIFDLNNQQRETCVTKVSLLGDFTLCCRNIPSSPNKNWIHDFEGSHN